MLHISRLDLVELVAAEDELTRAVRRSASIKEKIKSVIKKGTNSPKQVAIRHPLLPDHHLLLSLHGYPDRLEFTLVPSADQIDDAKSSGEKEEAP